MLIGDAYKTEHEELPQHLGWRRPAVQLVEDDLDRYMDEIRNLTAVLETREVPAAYQKRRGHFGW